MVLLQAKLSRARQAQLFDKDGKPFFRPNTGRAPSAGGSGAHVPRWESLYSQRNQAEEKRQQLKKQLEDEQREARSVATRVNPKSEKLLAGTCLLSLFGLTMPVKTLVALAFHMQTASTVHCDILCASNADVVGLCRSQYFCIGYYTQSAGTCICRIHISDMRSHSFLTCLSIARADPARRGLHSSFH